MTPRTRQLLIFLWPVGGNDACGHRLRLSSNGRKQVRLWGSPLLVCDVAFSAINGGTGFVSGDKSGVG